MLAKGTQIYEIKMETYIKKASAFRTDAFLYD